MLEDKSSFAKGPYLEVQDSFEKGKSLSELIEEGILPQGFRKIGMPQERPLYKHQEVALRKAASGANLIVSTGTGSGKTESFMIPILAHIIREHETGKLNPGVRALLIYPMNALANDQVERLRELLAAYPQITYGSYTGQTKHKYKEALADYLELNDGKKPLPNELISREQMKETPPHLLITNYAMLEYLMVRPGDNIFFSGEYADHWKYIVLDEAHVYNGGSGIEVAMLLRRLKATLHNDGIQYFLTSATLGSEESNQEVADFGKNLCCSEFKTENIIRAFRQKPKRERDSKRLPVDLYAEVAAQIRGDMPVEQINQLIKKKGFPIHDKFSDSFGWTGLLFNEDEANLGALMKADSDYQYEINVLSEAREEAFRNGKRVDGYTERLRVYRNEDILSFLSRKNVMPKYGFPVDSVELGIVGESVRGKLGLQLSRDLSLAISEYAPGSQIVANGNLITSRYIKKIPRMGWKMYDYIRCECNTLNIEVHAEDKKDQGLAICKCCGTALEETKRRTFIVPEFGFLADGDKIEKPGLKRPEKTYRGDISYVGFRNDVETERYEVDKSVIEITMSRGDEMAVLNEANFFVCKTCGYTDLDEMNFRPFKKLKHRNSGGFVCGNENLNRFALGYRFETDVFQLKFIEPELDDENVALSLLYALIRGACQHLNIEEDDIAGCIQFFFNRDTMRPNWSIVLYDRTPGGAGHVRRLFDRNVLANVFQYTLKMLNQCTCGGDDKDASCYTCLRNYYNQKYHDRLSRGKAMSFLQNVLG